jgi:polyhydroxybutyrate depolymerase
MNSSSSAVCTSEKTINPALLGPNDLPTAGTHRFSMMHGGKERTFYLHIPDSYQLGTPMPVVMIFHGAGGDGLLMMLLSRFNDKAEKEGFIAVYPEGQAVGGLVGDGVRVWDAGNCGPAQDLGDVGFIKELIARLPEWVSIDPDRIYLAGISVGGMFAQRLACQLPDRIAAVASIAGGLSLEFDDCNPGQPIPVLHFHALDDPVVPFVGGPGTMEGEWSCHKHPVPDIMSYWAEVSGLTAGFVEVYSHGEAICYAAFADPPLPDNEVGLCTTETGGHSWPGSPPYLGNSSQDINATKIMWDFFFAHH